jgi:hypothetical protein
VAPGNACTEHPFIYVAYLGIEAERIVPIFSGDWSSDAYKTYLKFSSKDKISVAIKMKDHSLDI